MLTSRFICLSIAAIVSACAPSAAPVEKTQTPHINFVHETSDLPPDPAVSYGTLPNGLRYAVMENSTPSKTAALHMRIGTGSINETDAQRGLAHFLEHMAFNGTKNVPEGDMIKRLERYGLSFGADTNASTGFEQTLYKLNLPNVKEEVIDEAFFLMRETAENILLDPAAIDRERGIIHSEKRTRDSASFRAMVHQFGFFTEGTGLVDRMPIGTDETIDSMPASEFEAYYRDYYHPKNTFVVFVGDFPKEQAIAKITDTFADWQPDTALARDVDLDAPTLKPGAVGYYTDPEITTSVILALVRPYREKPDTIATRRENTIKQLGNAILSRRLQRIVQQPNAKILSGGASSRTLFDLVEGPAISLRSTAKEWRDALAVGEQEMRRAVKYGFTQQELDEIVAKRLAAYEQGAMRANTRPTVSRYGGLVSSIIGAFSGDRVFTHPASSLQRFKSVAESITAEDVSDAFKADWQGYETPVVYLATSERLDAPQEEIEAALNASQAVEVKAPQMAVSQTFAYTHFGEPGRIVSETYEADIDAYLIRFSNNVMLNFKQTKFEDNTIRLSVKVGDGALSIPRKDEGLRRLALNLLSKGGLEAHSADELSTLFAGKTVFAGYGLGRESEAFEISGYTKPEDLADQMNLMAAYATAPGFRADVRDRYLRSLIDWFPTHDATPRSAGARYIPRLIRSGDTRYGYSGIESFTRPTIAEVRAWVEPQLRDGVVEITVVGDVEKKQVVDQVARTFGALPARRKQRGDYPQMTSLQFPAGNDVPETITHAGERNQVMYRVYWPSPDGTDVATRHEMRVLRSVFRNRLTKVIREDEAAAYSPGVGLYYNSLFEDYGYLSVSLDLTPDKVKPISDKVTGIAADFQAMNITQDEFDRAIQPLIEDLDSSLENNAFWMNSLADAQTSGDGLEDLRQREDIYKKMTLSDLKQRASSVFVEDRAYSIVVVPAEPTENR